VDIPRETSKYTHKVNQVFCTGGRGKFGRNSASTKLFRPLIPDRQFYSFIFIYLYSLVTADRFEMSVTIDTVVELYIHSPNTRSWRGA